MRDSRSLKLENRFFEKLAHRDQEYQVGEVKFRIVLFHALNHSRNRAPGLHSQTTLELSLIEKGCIEYFTRDKKIPVERGNVFFMPPGKRHNWRVLKRPFIITGFQLAMSTETDMDDFLRYFRRQARKKGYHLNDFSIFSEMLGKIREEFKSQTPYFMDNVNCLIRQLLIEFMRAVPLRIEEVPIENHSGFSNIMRTKIIKDFVKVNLSTPLILADVADHLNLSIRQLNRIFTDQEGMSLGTYILDTKIEAAKHELENTEKLIKEIAIYLGFDDVNYFCRIFRKKTGYSPSGYRQNHHL